MATSIYLRKMKRHKAAKKSREKIAAKNQSYENMDFSTRSKEAWKILKSGEVDTIKEAWEVLKSRG